MESNQGCSGDNMKLLILVAALGLLSACRAPERARYQVETTMANGPVVHMCDTWTGQVWAYSRSENRWEPLTALEGSDK